MAGKALNVDQCQVLHKYWQDDCCLCTAKQRIAELTRERDEARAEFRETNEQRQRFLLEVYELKALLLQATDALESEHATMQDEFGRCDDMYMGNPQPPCETCVLIKQLREKGGE